MLYMYDGASVNGRIFFPQPFFQKQQKKNYNFFPPFS